MTFKTQILYNWKSMQDEGRLHDFCLKLPVILSQYFSSSPPCLHVTTIPMAQDANCQIKEVLTDSVCSATK
jgi:hypothetical protein